MKQLKIVFLLLTFIFIMSSFAQANELEIKNQKNFSFMANAKSLSDFSPIKSQITNYKWSKDKKVKFFKNMGIAGIIVTATTFGVLMLPGIILVSVYYALFWTPATLTAANLYATGGLGGYLGLLYGGSALLALGIIGVTAGIALIIVGFVLSNYYKKKAAMYIPREPEKAYMTTGISIKLF